MQPAHAAGDATCYTAAMMPTQDRPHGEQRDGFERVLKYSFPKRTALDRMLVAFLALLTYPVWLVPETLRLWTAAKRATSWRRVAFIIQRITDWPVSMLPFVGVIVIVPVLLVLGWINRLISPPLRRG